MHDWSQTAPTGSLPHLQLRHMAELRWILGGRGGISASRVGLLRWNIVFFSLLNQSSVCSVYSTARVSP